MIQFNLLQIEQIRQKAKIFPQTIEKLKSDIDTVFNGEIVVPTSGIANWRLYYYCPNCSVKLDFSRNRPKDHYCSSCHTTFKGEPYDSSWWGIVTGENYSACYAMALLSLITNEDKYALKAKDILLECAKHYPNYEVHGDIPYNGPGRAGAQTLDEAGFQRNMALAYDLISDYFTEDEKITLRDNMFIPGALFLKEHRHNQLHNHEAIIDAAIAIIGMIFDNNDLINFAIYEKYGILYQLEYGMQDNCMWFEGSFGYHFFALQSLLEFEKFAINTKHSQIMHPNYKKMFEMVVDYIQPNHELPMLNDTTFGHSSHYDIFEFVYKYIKTDKILALLNNTYIKKDRDNIDALLYGEKDLEVAEITNSCFHTEVSKPGYTILRGKHDKYLLIKHDRYGGEHDHYDRLDLSYLAYNKRISPDLGTTGYGAVLHYDYYKNTASHNTICIGEENQAPVNAKLDMYKKEGDDIYVSCSLDYTLNYDKLDTFTIKQWSDEFYKMVKMTRKIVFNDNYFIELFYVDGVDNNLSIDWNMHFSGQLIENYKKEDFNDFGNNKVYKYFESPQKIITDSNYKLTYKDDLIYTYVYGYNTNQQIVLTKAFDNPSNAKINYIIERSYANSYKFGHVIETTDGDSIIDHVEFLENSVIVVHSDSTKKEYKL